MSDHTTVQACVSSANGTSSPVSPLPDAQVTLDDDGQVAYTGLTGAAKLAFEDRVVEMKAGDSINIPAHQKHRVEWTSPDEPTVWLAVFYGVG